MKLDAAQGKAHGADHQHGTGAAITVAAGQTGELVVTFPKLGTLQMACLIPGHYEAGMRGQVKVINSGRSTAPSAAHDHSTHKH
jgi:uncharacterized cupredoxin-like copper-binding protein